MIYLAYVQKFYSNMKEIFTLGICVATIVACILTK